MLLHCIPKSQDTVAGLVQFRRTSQAVDLTLVVHFDQMVHQIAENLPVIPKRIHCVTIFLADVQKRQTGFQTDLVDSLPHLRLLKHALLCENAVGISLVEQ